MFSDPSWLMPLRSYIVWDCRVGGKPRGRYEIHLLVVSSRSYWRLSIELSRPDLDSLLLKL
jgi:hypothetical protein